MIDLPYSLIIEATDEPDYFGFYSPNLEGFTGIGHSVEDCIYKARWGMREHVALLRKQGLPVPQVSLDLLSRYAALRSLLKTRASCSSSQPGPQNHY